MIALLLTWMLCAAQQPNIVWITSEDNGPHLGCYGFEQARTPNLDALAARGMRFENAWSNAPVCAPARTTIITGMYATSLGAQHMRSRVALPPGYELFPQLLRGAGYYCSNRSKTDYNLTGLGQVWDQSNKRAHWRGRRPGQPFFAVFNFTTTHESATRRQPHQQVQDPETVELPGYLPDLPEVRQGWAQYYDQMAVMDGQVGNILKQLQDDGLADDTIVFYFSDHGPGFPRAKRWPGNSGLHVPMLAYFPPRYRHLAPAGYSKGGSSKQLVSFVDLAPTVLSLAGVKAPDYYQGHAFAGETRGAEAKYLYGFRGRMDERIDMCRSVRDQRYVYIRNYYPRLPHGQHLNYLFQTPATQAWWRAFEQGKLPDEHRQYWLPRASEELYDLQADPAELHNLAANEKHADDLKRLRAANHQHMLRIRDLGFLPEAEMHRMANGQAPALIGRDPSRYPLAQLLQRAGADDAENQDPVFLWGEESQFLSLTIAQAEHQAPAQLLKWADPANSSLYFAVQAWNAMQRVDQWTAEQLEHIAQLPTEVDGAPKALSNYLPRLKERFFQTHQAPKGAGNNE